MNRPGPGPHVGPDTAMGANRQDPDSRDRIGHIQPHGFLLAVDPVTREVRVVSENLAEFIGVAATEALGAGLGDLFDPSVLDQLPLPGVEGRGDTQPRAVRIPPRHVSGATAPDASRPDPADVAAGAREIWDEFEVVAHRSEELWVLEFELASPDHEGLGSLYDSFRRTLDHLRSVSGVDALCAAAAREVQALTGYDRVLVYRLERGAAEGEVVADAHRPDLASQLGLSYPEDDDQVRARIRSLQNWIHSTSDSARSPVALLSSPGVAAGGGLDLAMCVLRPVPEADRVFQLATGVIATLTVSLVVDGRLWGLLVCQHQSARRVSHQLRASCEMLGRVLSLQVRAELARREQDQTARLARWVEALVLSMSRADSLAVGAADARAALLGMVGADGVVLQVDGTRITAGRTPVESGLDLLLRRVVALAGRDVPPWTTDSLPALELSAGLEGPSPISAAATGVMYLPLGGRDRDYALWLRGEHIRTVSWAGASDPGSDASRGAWEQLVRGRSRPWSAAERAAAESFASAQPSLMLHRAQRVLVEQELAAAADRVNAAADRQELEHRLHQNQRLESLGHLAGGVAHDFNNLLAVILSYTEFVGDQVDAQVRTVGGQEWRGAQEDLEQVKAATRRAAELTRQLLAFARREVVELRPVSLDHVVRGLEDLLRRTIGERIDLVVQLAGHVSPIMADPGQIEQILVNLAVNARDAMPDGGSLRITTRDVGVPPPTPGGAPGQRQVLLEVGDEGTGIAQEILDRIFEPFFTTKATGEGTGLGLATVHGIVAQIGGVIRVESEVGQGTTFSMEFPATDAVVDAPDRAGDAASHGGGETVLVVEDQDDVREVTRRLLTRAGYTVLTAANGYQALEVVAAHPTPVDLLLTDLVMPFMTGDEVASRLRALQPGLRVLFMSGYAAPVLAAAGSFEADHPLLDKPFSRSGLLSKVLEVLDQPPTPATPTPVTPTPATPTPVTSTPMTR